MSSQGRNLNHRGFAVVALAAAAFACASPPAPPPDPASAPAEPAQAPALPDLTDIEAQLTEIRGLKFLKDVPAEHQSMEDWAEYLDEELETMFPPDKVGGFMAGLVRLGMLKQPIDLSEEFKSALLSQAGAYYDPETGKFYYLMTDMAPVLLQTVAAHELVHALQDQHFKLGALLEKMEEEQTEDVRNDDQVLAVRFLVEGEATYVQTLWQTKTMGMDLSANPEMETMAFRMQANMEPDALIQLSKQVDMSAMGLEGGDIAKAIESMDKIPPYILHPLMAAYIKGAYFTMELRHAGGWERVAEAYRNLPTTSEQVMHPDKFTGPRDEPTLVTLPALDDLDRAGWKQIDSARHGEYYLALLLRNFDCPGPKANRATAGWDGDLYRAYQREDGCVMFALVTTWDSEKDAQEFFDAYKSILKVKCGLAEPVDNYVQDSGEIAYPSGNEADDTGRLARRGREVFIVEGAPAELASDIIRQAKAMEVRHAD
ncbi:MAG: hypothetical protein IT430_13785 [Phycisphaerales bacterium]|nr:hypothetical protein [Phycisphaerales bacterium]